MPFRLKGLERFKKSARRKRNLIATGVARGLFKEGEGIMTISKQAYVPVDTGTLRASGFVDRPIRRGTKILVMLGYGGPAAPYAIFVHEDMDAFHVVGQAKYLEVPFRRARRGMAKRLARDARKQLKRSK